MGLATDLKRNESLMTNEEAVEILKTLIEFEFVSMPRGSGKTLTRFKTVLALHKAVKALESRN